jgi:hypothetical protein
MSEKNKGFARDVSRDAVSMMKALVEVMDKWGSLDPRIKAVMDALAEVEDDDVPRLTEALAAIGNTELLGLISMFKTAKAEADAGRGPIYMCVTKFGLAQVGFNPKPNPKDTPEMEDMRRRGNEAIETLNQILEANLPDGISLR